MLMLDAYIIDQIRREREERDRREGSQIPLYIEDIKQSENPRSPKQEPENPDQGSVKIDFLV
jgi:hypothetical protein